MFGDNRSVVTSSTIPNSTISKRHHFASYHRVREAIAAKYISFHLKDGKSNPADIISKHWEFATVWPMLKPILFWRRETATQLNGSDRIPSTTPGAKPLRDARDSGSARSHSTHLETSSSDRPKWSPTWIFRRKKAIFSLRAREGRYVCQISRAQRMHNRPSVFFPSGTQILASRPTHVGRPTRTVFSKITKLTHCSIYMSIRTISFPQTE